MTQPMTTRDPGERMPDGTIYAGVSPYTGKPMYTTPADAPLTYIFSEAKKYAAGLAAHGYHDWRIPKKDELNVLFNNRAAIGGFKNAGSDHTGWYWSSLQANYGNPWAQRFSDGKQFCLSFADDDSSLRCVRG